MFLIARKNLFQEKLRLLISILGISFSVMLMLSLLGIYYGMSDQFVRYSTENSADIVVTQKGVKDMYVGISLVSNDIKMGVEQIQGVESATGVIQLKGYYEKDAIKNILTLTTYENSSDIGKPWNLVEGRHIRNNQEIVIGNDFMRRNGLNLNDKINIYNTDFTIVGIMEKSSFINAYYGFISTNKGIEILNIPNYSNYLFVKVKDKSKIQSIINYIENLSPNINVTTKEDFIKLNLDVLEETFLPIVLAIVIIGFLVGTTIIGVTIYTSTLDKQTEYGVLKSVGISNFQLYKLLFQQAIILTILGLVLGLLFAFIAKELLSLSIPFLEVKINVSIFSIIAILSIFMSTLSVMIPAKRIASIDPAIVFKS